MNDMATEGEVLAFESWKTSAEYWKDRANRFEALLWAAARKTGGDLRCNRIDLVVHQRNRCALEIATDPLTDETVVRAYEYEA